MTTELLRTPLHDWHVKHGGRMVDFAGWSMPVQYSSIAEEHNATRNAVGVFDISHMGRLQFRGSGVLQFVDSVLTRRVVDIKLGQVRYSLVCNEQGGILDDVLFYDGTDENAVRPVLHGPDLHDLVVNASNREKIVAWVRDRLPVSVRLNDLTQETAMIAVQGPKAVALVEQFIQCVLPVSKMRYYTSAAGDFDGTEVVISRTGYTGEDGVEIICDADKSPAIWEKCIEAAGNVGGMAAGLGARDTLRLEAAMPLYGHELSETINPIQAGLNFAVNLGGRKFIGSAALEKFAADKSQPVRVGLECEGKRVPRQGCPVLHNGEIVGEVTSGTYSPTLDRPIAMAYVQPSASAIGTQLTTDIRGTRHPAIVVPLPFYQREKKK
jgi:aminomethyltransferase